MLKIKFSDLEKQSVRKLVTGFKVKDQITNF